MSGTRRVVKQKPRVVNASRCRHRVTIGLNDSWEVRTVDRPFLYAFLGTVLLAIGGMLFVNLDEDPQYFIVFTTLFAAPGLFLLVAGAVERGIRLSRQ